MGDLSNEYQDAVIAANYVNTDEEATALEVVFTTPEGTTIEQIEKILNYYNYHSINITNITRSRYRW